MEHNLGPSAGDVEILHPCPACAQDFRFPSAPGKTEQYSAGRHLIPAFPSFRGTDKTTYGGGMSSSKVFSLPSWKASAGFVTASPGL